MPEPNLPPLHVAVGPISQGAVNANILREQLPEMPSESRSKLVDNCNLTLEQAVVLVVSINFKFMLNNIE